MAEVEGVLDVPIRRSTFSSSISFAALRAAVDGSEASSSWMIRIFSYPTALAKAAAAAIPLA
jgi:uncharacterized protein YfiM (DUF2279 family)